LSGGKLFHTLVPAAVKVLSPKLLYVRLTASVRVSAERSCLTWYVGDQLTIVDQVVRSMAGQELVDNCRDLEQDALPHLEASAAGGAQ